MTKEEMGLIRGFVENIQSLKGAHLNDGLPINYGMLCMIIAKGWELLKELEALEKQPCEDAISREDVIKAVDRHTFDTDDGLCLDEDISIILESLSSVAPTRKKGKWICFDKDRFPINPHCTNCGGEPYYFNDIHQYKYCPYCGCLMQEEE